MAPAEPTEIQDRTGLPLDPGFTAGKWRWLLDAAPEGAARAADGEIRLGTVDSWVLWNLTGGAVHATDASNASRTQLMDLAAVAWDPWLAEAFGVPLAALPQIRPSSAHFGQTVAIGSLAGRRAGRRRWSATHMPRSSATPGSSRAPSRPPTAPAPR